MIGRVSTRSRAKAAGTIVLDCYGLELFQLAAARRRLGFNRYAYAVATACFNSQPREGGWHARHAHARWRQLFQLAAARRRLV